MYVAITLVKWLMKGLYAIMKLLPVRNRVCFFSRQSNTITPDFRLLSEELKRRGDTETVMICHHFKNLRDGAFVFAWDMLKSMYYLATSKVCVLDAYWPTVSMLKHKKELTVIQIWHSLGKIKQSGYQTLGKEAGRGRKMAELLCMHRNYDYVIGGGSAWNRYYCAAFDIDESKLRNYGLPRLDEVLQGSEEARKLTETYPELKDKTVVLYAPTWRKEKMALPHELMELFRSEKYVLICRFHPNQEFSEPLNEELHRYDATNTFNLLQGCDYFITDYSSLALEAAAIEKKTLYYVYDCEQYLAKNGLNINLFDAMPGCTFKTAREIYEMIESGSYPCEELRRFRSAFLPEDMGNSAKKIVDLMEEGLRK